MNYNYLRRSHNKIYKRKNIIYKFFKSPRSYYTEKNFYLNYKDKFNFIPKLYYYSDKRFCIIIENVGQRIRKKNINFDKLQEINKELISQNIYHNDYRVKNILYNAEKDKYYFIDFEHVGSYFNDFRKSPESDDIRGELFVI